MCTCIIQPAQQHGQVEERVAERLGVIGEQADLVVDAEFPHLQL